MELNLLKVFENLNFSTHSIKITHILNFDLLDQQGFDSILIIRYPLNMSFFSYSKISSRKGTWGNSCKSSEVFKVKDGPGVGAYTIVN